MFVYETVVAATESTTTANPMYTTNATPNNLTDHLRYLTAAGRPAYIQACYLTGRGGGLTSISGITIRFIRLGTASTVGTAASIRPRDPSSPAAVTTAFTAPTIGTTATLQLSIGCGAAGPGGWVAQNPDSSIYLAPGGGATGNLDMISGSATASLNFDAVVEHNE